MYCYFAFQYVNFFLFEFLRHFDLCLFICYYFNCVFLVGGLVPGKLDYTKRSDSKRNILCIKIKLLNGFENPSRYRIHNKNIKKEQYKNKERIRNQKK